MFIDNGRAFIEARLLELLTAMFGDFDIGNGTPLADALAAAIAADMRTARASASELDALGRDALADAAGDLLWVLKEGRDEEFLLPFGTRAVSRVPGGVKIGEAHYMLDAGRPGLHPMEITRQDAHGPNLERLQALIERKTRKLACRRLGRPNATSVAINDMRHNLQFPPCAEAGGVVLQRRASETGADRFCAAMPSQLAALADSIVRDMRELWKHRAVIGKRVNAVRHAAEGRILAEHGPDGPVSITAIAVELCGERGDKPISLYVEMDSIDEALRPGKTLDYIPSRTETDGEWFRLNDNYAYRTGDLAELTALGATGRISELAAGVAATAPEGQKAVLARLGRDLETQVVVPTSSGDLYATLYWQNGYIEAEVSMPGYLESYSRKIELRTTLPATVVTAMVDRPLCDFVALPFRLATPVDNVEECAGGWLRLTVEYGHSLVNCDSGEIWPEPKD